MTPQAIPTSKSERLVESSTTQDILRSAMAHQAVATVRVQGAGFVLECLGLLVDVDGGSIGLKLERFDESVRTLCAGRPPTVAFEANATRYVFESTSAIQWQDSASGFIRLPKPSSLTLADRRRSERRRLKQGATVTLQMGKANDSWTSQGAMLNLSREGIACRIAREDASRMEVGCGVLVRFGLEEVGQSFEWSARVTNITEGGTAGRSVVGLEFIIDHEGEADRARLCRVLEAQRFSGYE